MLPKEVKNILEGVHYFLLEDLKNEALSGKVECMRRGLLLQLEALKDIYPLQFTTKFDPNANIRNSSSVSLPYLNSDQLIVNGSSRMSTSSSGSANYSTGYSNESSTGYSGDGVVSSHSQNGGSENAHSDFSSENYEEFDDATKVHSVLPCVVDPPKRKTSSELQRQDSRASSGYDDREDQDDDCFVDADPIPFRFLIAKCDYHNGLLKRSKGLLKTYKSFLGVLTGSLLYLYQKDTDDQQRKIIDLTGYEVRDCKKELKGRQKNGDFTFELIRPGRKTHTFYSAKRKDREMWIEHLKRATIASKPTYQNSSIILQRFPLAKVEEMSLQQNLEEGQAKEGTEGEDEGEEADDGDEDVYDDFYEELNIEAESIEYLHKSVSSVPSAAAQNDISYYYTVPEDMASLHSTAGRSKRSPPERPPLPQMLMGKRPPAKRPLPEAPEEVSFDEDDSHDDIYCEIEGDGGSSNLLMCTHSLSQEIFDTINQRVTPLPDLNHRVTPLPDLNHRVTSLSEMFPQNSTPEVEEENEFESYDVPSDVSIFSIPGNLPKSSGKPSLPPKGMPNANFDDDDDDDSDYKVPTFSIFPDNIYNVPSPNPVAVNRENGTEVSSESEDAQDVEQEKCLKSIQKETPILSSIDGQTSESDSLTQEVQTPTSNVNNYDANPCDEINVVEKCIQSAKTAEKSENEARDKLDSTRSLVQESENDNQTPLKKESRQLEICTSNSVKDLIAKLNQNESQRESFSTKKYGSFKNKISEQSKLSLAVENQRESSYSLVCLSEKLNDIKIQENVEAKEENECSQNENKKNIFNISKIKNLIESKSELSENIKNKFSNFIDMNFPLSSSDVSIVEKYQDLNSNDDRLQGKQSVYIAKFAFVSIDPETLSFSRGDEIVVTETKDETRWLKGIIKGKEGLVPKEYLRKKDEPLSTTFLDSKV